MTAAPADARRIKRALALLDALERLDARPDGVVLSREPDISDRPGECLGSVGSEGPSVSMATLAAAILVLGAAS